MEIANNTITNEESYWPKHAIQDSTISQFNVNSMIVAKLPKLTDSPCALP